MERKAKSYRGIEISHFYGHPAKKRFPAYDPLSDFQDLHGDWHNLHASDPFDATLPPAYAPWRSNLVALSQKENLYFAAYVDRIHVTVPYGLTQHVAGTPDLIIELPETEAARRCGGYIDPDRPHAVNNMCVGDLGSQEILLVVCDDGDILGFDVRSIMGCVQSPTTTATVKPFFHENLGASAWGIAIHSKSRLIAASCNDRHITVFMPAVTGAGETTTAEELDIGKLPKAAWTVVDEIPPPDQPRPFNTKKIFRLGEQGHNLPDVSFADDAHGHAISILGCDISGFLWIFGLYDGTVKCIPRLSELPASPDDRQIEEEDDGDAQLEHASEELMFESRSWGVVVLPLSVFRCMDKFHDALGGTRHLQSTLSVGLLDEKPVKVFDMTGSISPNARNPPSSSRLPDTHGFNTSALVLESDSDDSDSSGDEPWTEFELQMASRLNSILTRATAAEHPDGDNHAYNIWSQRSLSPIQRMQNHAADHARRAARKPAWSIRDIENMVNMLPQDLAFITPDLDAGRAKDQLHKFLERLAQSKKTLAEMNGSVENPDARPHLPNGCAILRTYQNDVELLPPAPACPRTLYRNLIRHPHIHPAIINRGYSRLSMQLFIPELCLVVVAAQAGRAALLSPTRIDDADSLNGPVVSFRVDGFLPAREARQERVWPRRPLLGIAASSIQTARGVGVENRKRWRLFMHYYDHSILTWELSRDVGTDVLVAL